LNTLSQDRTAEIRDVLILQLLRQQSRAHMYILNTSLDKYCLNDVYGYYQRTAKQANYFTAFSNHAE